jgi:hypothetical protein
MQSEIAGEIATQLSVCAFGSSWITHFLIPLYSTGLKIKSVLITFPNPRQANHA